VNTGDLVLFRGHGPFDWFIRLWTRSAWAHCGLVWVCEGIPLVIEAQYSGGVSVHALANRMADDPFITPSGRAMNLPLALQHFGDWYSLKNAVDAGLGYPLHHAGWECAQFAAFLLGMDMAEDWTPQSLLDELTPSGGHAGGN